MEPVTFNEVIGIVIAASSAVAGAALLLARSYFKSYVNEKAKNLATKEDLKDITRLVEEVKHEFSIDLEERRTKNQLRMAALDKRLQAHQEAFALWRRLMITVYKENIGELVIECQTWWNHNCLYLEPEARDAFSNAYFSAAHHQQFSQSLPRKAADIELLKKNFDNIKTAGDIILKAVQLPGLTPQEKAEVAKVNAST